MRSAFFAFAVIALLALPAFAMPMQSNGQPVAPPPPASHLIIKNRAFSPAEIDVPVGQKIELIISNQDTMPAEFESSQLKREKVVPANSTITVTIGPLTAGTYPFFNDFDPAKAKGSIVAK